MNDVTNVYFVRHAIPDPNIKTEQRPLSEQGIADSYKVRDFFVENGICVDAIYSSPFTRTLQTIEPLRKVLNLELNIRNDLREREIGRWVEDFNEFATRQWSDFDYKLEKDLANSESLREVQRRNISCLNEILLDNEGKNIVISSHGTAISVIINYFDDKFGVNEFFDIAAVMPFILNMKFKGSECILIDKVVSFEK